MFNIKKALSAKNEAENLTKNMKGYVWNGPGDAARHAIAGGLITRRISPDAARFAHMLNETVLGLGQPKDEEEMDNFNTSFGIDLAPEFASDQEFIGYIMNVVDSPLMIKLNKRHR